MPTPERASHAPIVVQLLIQYGGVAPLELSYACMHDITSRVLTSSEASGPSVFPPIHGTVLAHLQEWRSTLVRALLTIAIVVGLWVAFDPFGALLFSAILVAVVWLWDR